MTFFQMNGLLCGWCSLSKNMVYYSVYSSNINQAGIWFHNTHIGLVHLSAAVCFNLEVELHWV